MPWLRRIAQLPIVLTHGIVRVLTAGFDALTGLVGRVNDRVETHLVDRTPLLRAHYADPTNRRAAPVPVLDSLIDLARREGIR